MVVVFGTFLMAENIDNIANTCNYYKNNDDRMTMIMGGTYIVVLHVFAGHSS